MCWSPQKLKHWGPGSQTTYPMTDTAELNMTFTDKRFNIREKLGGVAVLKLLVISSVPVDHASQSTE